MFRGAARIHAGKEHSHQFGGHEESLRSLTLPLQGRVKEPVMQHPAMSVPGRRLDEQGSANCKRVF
jgi:hypothetical protein